MLFYFKHTIFFFLNVKYRGEPLFKKNNAIALLLIIFAGIPILLMTRILNDCRNGDI